MKKQKFKSLITPLVNKLKSQLEVIYIDGIQHKITMFEDDFNVDDDYVYFSFDTGSDFMGEFKCTLKIPLSDVVCQKFKEHMYDFNNYLEYEEICNPEDDELTDKISEMFNYLCYMTVIEDMDKYGADEDDDAFIDGFDNEYSYYDYNDEFSCEGWENYGTHVVLRCCHDSGSGCWSLYEIPLNDSWKDNIKYIGYQVM